MRNIHRILVCRTSHSLGSTLLITPVIRELQRCYPGAEIDIVCRNAVSPEIFKHFDNVRVTHVLPRRIARQLPHFFAEFARLRQVRYDLVIDTSRSSQSDRLMLLWASGRYKVGFARKYGSHVLSSAVDVPSHVTHVGQLPVYLVRRAMEADPETSSYPVPDVLLSDEERQTGRSILRRVLSPDPRRAEANPIGIFANGTGAKQFPNAWWKAFTKALHAHYPNHAFVELIPFDGASRLDDRYPSFYTTDIRKLAGAIANLALFISPDCGVMHLACAARTTTVGLFSVTKPAEWAPYGDLNGYVDTRAASAERIAEQIACRYPLRLAH